MGPDASFAVLRFCDRAHMKHAPTAPAPRYALYFAPEEGSDWQRFGGDWFARIPEAPRRYGFHATLKAPFRLAGGFAVEDLLDELRQYCTTLRPFTLAPLKVTLLDDFLALVPSRPDPRVDSIAAECVMRFDRFRAPLDEADLSRRRPERLDRGEMDMLQHWGYPYVLNLFRFHLSLTGTLAPVDAERTTALRVKAIRDTAALEPPRFASICVYEEPGPHALFRLVERVCLGGQAHATCLHERTG